jgi:branched-chain amino acid transport system substrate-binding protein
MLMGAVAAAALALPVPAAQAQIRIATAGPMTGQYAAFGQQMKEGAEQAVADINAAGGVLGQKLELSIGDDACDPRQAVSVANDLASKGVQMVAGHFCSGSSIPASKVYADEGILEISPASTNPKYTDDGSWNTFRICGRDDQQGKVAGSYIAAHFRDRKVAILNDNSAYGHGLAEKPEIVVLTKGDAMTPRETAARRAALARAAGQEVAVISAATGAGIPDLLRRVMQAVAAARRERAA